MKTSATRAILYIMLFIVAFVSVFPIAWMAVSATNTSNEVLSGKLLPGTNIVTNYENLLASQDLYRALFNSLRNSVVVTFSALLLCSMAGYGFEIYHDKAKDRLFSILLLAMMIPFAALMIPLFQIFARMKLLNTTLAIALPTIATPFLIMFFRQSARSFPQDLIEAARIDGLGEFRIFLQIFFPTMKATYVAGLTVTFMSAWNNYLWPRIVLLKKGTQTMPMLVSNLTAGYVTDFGVVMLGVLITTIPTVVIFLSLQRYITMGIVGAVK